MRHAFLLGVIGLTTSVSLAGSTLILDDFDADPNDDAGGPREIGSAIVSNPFNQPASFDLDTGFSFGGDTGAMFFNSGIGVEQEGRIYWTNNGAGLGLNATALGITGFEFDYLQVDQDFTFRMVLTDSAENDASFEGTVVAGGAQTFVINWGDFTVDAGFDASDIAGIYTTYNPRADQTASLDFVLTEFRAVVPAPGPVAMLGLGGLLAARRRR